MLFKGTLQPTFWYVDGGTYSNTSLVRPPVDPTVLEDSPHVVQQAIVFIYLLLSTLVLRHLSYRF